jgi:SAM-dependent methyltransferase
LTASLPFTGERFTPEIKGAIWYEHWHRYCAALPVAAGKRVLDAACGEGYGSWLLARTAQSVTGIDIDRDAIAHAARRYGGGSSLRYVPASCTQLPFADASFDLVVSFETIEHLAEQEAMLDEFRRVLTPAGAVIISSPNKDVYSEQSEAENHFHVHELARPELATMLDARFERQTWYGQRVLAHSLLWAEARPRGPAELLALVDDGRVESLTAPAAPMYFVVVCGGTAARLPELPAFSTFEDGAQSLYRDYQRALLAEKRLYWEEIDARRIAEQRLDEAIAAVNELAGARQRESALNENVAHLERERERVAAELRHTSNALEQATARIRYRESLRGWLRWPLSRVKRALSADPS